MPTYVEGCGYVNWEGFADKPGEEPPTREVVLCKEWLQQYAYPTKTFRPHSSYFLKHVVERWAGEYVSNGAFIQAALDLGYSIHRIDNSPNAVFNMSFPRWLLRRFRTQGDRALEGKRETAEEAGEPVP